MGLARRNLLLILDGWGQAPDGPGNAARLAGMDNVTRLMAEYPTTRLRCAGRAVGLPEGFMGNSEVGHMNIGAGRVVYQDMTRIDMAIEQGRLAENATLAELFAKARQRGGAVHFLGLVSDGGVHSHLHHLKALLQAAKNAGVRSLVHAFLDGRDTPPKSGAGYVRDLRAFLAETGTGQVASLCGRYWAMDRDKRWERVERAYAMLTEGRGEAATDPVAAVETAYAEGQTDEFVEPRLVLGPDGQPAGLVRDGDAVFFFNFRADRARELTSAFIFDAFDGFARPARPKLAGFATMTEYESTFGLPTAFPPAPIDQTLGEVFSKAGLRQLRLAETEKYAHVTYFLSCGHEEPFPGEDRALIPSPREVATYDLKPEMSARQVTDSFLEKWAEGYDLCVVNLANPDMVGHTGVLEAAVTACRVVDECVGRIEKAVLDAGGRIFLTADHGNVEEMIAPDGGPMTAHTLNDVAFVLVDPARRLARLRQGVLGDIAPTILELAGLPKPEAMTGQSLVSPVGEGA